MQQPLDALAAAADLGVEQAELELDRLLERVGHESRCRWATAAASVRERTLSLERMRET